MVESRTSEIDVYNSQAQALTAADMCRVLAEEGSVDLGEASVACTEEGDGVLRLTVSKDELSASILANATDKFVIEYLGSDESHEYRNNLGQSLRVRFDFVATGTHRTAEGVVEAGSYRGDLLIVDGQERYRFGYYFNEKLQ